MLKMERQSKWKQQSQMNRLSVSTRQHTRASRGFTVAFDFAAEPENPRSTPACVVCVWPNRLPLLCAAPPLGLSEKSVEKIVAKQAALGWSAALCPITHCFGPELEMALNTEQEEKRLLREQMHNLEVQTRWQLTHATC